ncbi:uncharacterized protein V1510DRAFT_405086 [Dipodascopsis tothii]|uniref:uncharacterized protein n=1 Tax=Dipodascopsis tothii TaxID=44089 RepID=UPI0034CE4D78
MASSAQTPPPGPAADRAEPADSTHVSVRIASPAALPFAPDESFRVRYDSTVGSLKELILARFGDEPPEPDALRLIFQGRFLSDSMLVADVVKRTYASDGAVTFHLVLKPGTGEAEQEPRSQLHSRAGAAEPAALGLASGSAYVPSPNSSMPAGGAYGFGAPAGGLAAGMGGAAAGLGAVPTAAAYPVPTAPSPVNIVLYQDPAAPLLTAETAVPLQTPNGHLALLFSPQGIANFAAVGIHIQPGISPTLLNAEPLPTAFPRRHFDADARAVRVRAFTPDELFRRVRALVASLRRPAPAPGAEGGAERMRATMSLVWLLLRLVIFVGIFSGELFSMRFWNVAGFACGVFLWQANVLGPAVHYLWAQFVAPHVEAWNLNVTFWTVNRNRRAPDGRTEEPADAARPPEPAAVARRPAGIVQEIKNVLVIFVGTLVPAIYDGWRRQEREHATEVARLQRQRDEELQRAREQVEAELEAEADAAAAALGITETDPAARPAAAIEDVPQ